MPPVIHIGKYQKGYKGKITKMTYLDRFLHSVERCTIVTVLNSTLTNYEIFCLGMFFYQEKEHKFNLKSKGRMLG
jgi:hypothetical protein